MVLGVDSASVSTR